MIHPKLLPHQELALHRVNVQQQSFATGCGSLDHSVGVAPLSAHMGSSSSSGAAPVRGEPNLTSTGNAVCPASSATLTKARPRAQPRDTPITGGGTNSIGPASIARPEVRRRVEWEAALDYLETFELPPHLLRGSTPATRSQVSVHYIADHYDRLWLSRQQSVAAATKGKMGAIDSPAATPDVSTEAATAGIPLQLFEELITAFELGSYSSPEIPVHRQPVDTFEAVVAIGASSCVVEEVRQYWLSKRQALGGNVPCLPALRMNVREDNHSALCHNEILQYCPLPFNRRDWSVSLLNRNAPSRSEERVKGEGEKEADGETVESTGRKRKRRMPSKSVKEEDTNSEGAVEAEECERETLLVSSLRVAQSVLQREEWKLAHTHVALYELSLVRRLAAVGNEGLDGVFARFATNNPGARGSGSTPTLWSSDESLQEEWVDEGEHADGLHDGVAGRVASSALESVMAISRRLC
ncbi:hypothetical protein TRVL_05536 [Trypanosoma vivax]|nr:hypothetical protein TRVL_05536 [Trypanosoma vivax]